MILTMSSDAEAIAWYLHRTLDEDHRGRVEWPPSASESCAPRYIERLPTRDLAALFEELERGGASAGRAGVDAATRPCSAFGLLLRSCADVSGVVEAATTYWRVLSSSVLERRDVEGGVELVIVDSWKERGRGHDLYTRFLVGLLVGALRHSETSPVRIALPGGPSAVSDGFGVPTSVGSDLARVQIATSDLGRIQPRADGLVATYLRSDLTRSMTEQKMAFSQRVDDLIRARLEDGLGMQEAAKALSLSERTLRRRLDEEGTSFRERLDHVRRARALDLLAREEIGVVARNLGFVDARSFQRAFVRWTQQTPTAYRRSLAR